MSNNILRSGKGRGDLVIGLITGEYAVKPGAPASSNDGDCSLLAHLPRFPFLPPLNLFPVTAFLPALVPSPARPKDSPRISVFSPDRIFLVFSPPLLDAPRQLFEAATATPPSDLGPCQVWRTTLPGPDRL
jgi:hypothetical protein